MYLKGRNIMQQSWKIAFAYIGVIVGAGLSSGQDLLQYFISLPNRSYWCSITRSIKCRIW